MKCYVSCFLAVGLLIASLATMFNTEKTPIMKDYISKLNEKQREKYLEIATERRNIYLGGFTIGFILALIYLYINGDKGGKWLNICIVGAITFVFSYFYYILYPKKDNMIKYLDEEEDREAWWRVYQVMQKYYHIGFIIGVVGVMVLCNAFY